MKTMLFSVALTSALFAQTATTSPAGSNHKTQIEKQTQPASSDVKDAGSDTKDVGSSVAKAGKAVGRATKKGVKTGYHHTKKGVKTAADKTSDALSDDKKNDATNPPPADTTTPQADTTQPK
jgi:hypothetical protein